MSGTRAAGSARRRRACLRAVLAGRRRPRPRRERARARDRRRGRAGARRLGGHRRERWKGGRGSRSPPHAELALIGLSSRSHVARLRRSGGLERKPGAGQATTSGTPRAAAPSGGARVGARLRRLPRSRGAARGRLHRALGERRVVTTRRRPAAYFDQGAGASRSTTARRRRSRRRSPRRMSPELAVPRGMSSSRFRAMGSEIQLLVPDRLTRDATRAVESLFAEWEEALSRFRPLSELCGSTRAPSPLTSARSSWTPSRRRWRRRTRPAGSSIRRSATARPDRLPPVVRRHRPCPRAGRVRAAAAPGDGSPSTARPASSPCRRAASSTWAGSPRAWPSTRRSGCSRASEPRRRS